MPQLKPYPKYKPSGIPWLGNVPQHSDVTAIRRLFSVINGGTPTPDDENWNGTIPWATPVDLAGVNGGRLSATARSITSLGLASGSRSVPADSLIISTRAPIGYVAETTAQETAFNQGCRGLVPRIPLDIRYFRYQILSLDESLNSLGNGSTFTELSSTSLADFKVLVLPLSEQRAIADYLDRQTELMDALVAKKKRMVELLAERRQSLIAHAVTKGLDPDVKLKPSSIQWIGEIPQHWEIRRLKTCVQDVIQSSNGVAEGELCLALEHVESWTGKYKEVGPEERLVSQTKRFLPNDVLFGKLGPRLAKVARPDKAGICVGEFLVLRTDPSSMTPNYLEQLIRSKPVIDAINSSTFGVIMPRTDWKFIGNMRQPLPPLSEQRAIADYLDRQTKLMDALIEKHNRQIELLAECRQSLITHAVTGKIDIRNHNMSTTTP